MSTELSLFDYGQLDVETRITVKQRTEEIKTLVRRSAQDIIDIGNKLIDVKQRLGHGGFGEWLDQEFGWSDQTARRFMHVAEFAKINTSVDFGKFQAKALYLIAAPSTPESARSELVDRSNSGEDITAGKAAVTIANHRTPPPPPTHRAEPEPARTFDAALPATQPPVDRLQTVAEPPVDRPRPVAARPLTDNEVEAVIWRAIAHHAKSGTVQHRLAWLQAAEVSDFSRLLNPGVSFEAEQLGQIKSAIEAELSKVATPATEDYDNDEYYTPSYIVEPGREALGGIDLDPASCAAANEVIKATVYYDKTVDGLLLPWRGNIWLNPPYSNPFPWIEKLFAEYEAGRVTTAIVLVNTANSPKWARLLWQNVTEASVCMLSSRIKFWRPDRTDLKGFDRDQMLWWIGPTKHPNSHARFRRAYAEFGPFR